jgi:hypothetical protein
MGKSRKEELNIPVMIFCIVGIVLTVLGFMLEKDRKFKLDIISSTGTVTGVTTSNDADGNVVSRSVTLSYIANKSSYTASISSPDNAMVIGDKMELYYDFFDPTSVSDKRSGYQGYLCLIIGIILVLKTGPRFYRIIKDNYL